MDLKEKLIQLSEQKEIGEFYSKELDETVFYTKLNTKDGTALGKILQIDDNIIAKLLVKSLCNADGELLFKASDIEYINRLPVGFTSDLFEQILIFNKMIPNNNVSPEVEAEKN